MGSERDVTHADFVDRFLATALDAVLVFVVGNVVAAFLSAILNSVRDDSAGYFWLILSVALLVLSPLLVTVLVPFVFERSVWQGTPGKRMLGLKVVAAKTYLAISAGTTLKRLLLRVVSGLPLLYGLFSVALNDDNTAWHDSRSKTAVVRDPRRYWRKEKSRTMKSITVTNSSGVVIIDAERVKNVTTQVAQQIGQSECSDELKSVVQELAMQLQRLSKEAPAASSDDIEKLTRNFDALGKELGQKKPDKRWYELSISGMTEAAEALGELATPILSIVAKLSSILLGA